MTQRTTAVATTCVLVCVYLACDTLTAAQPPADASGTSLIAATDPPTRPLRVTPEQIAALEQIADQPAYAVAPDTRAAYSPKAQKQATEISAVAFYFGYAGSLAWVLIAAAPL